MVVPMMQYKRNSEGEVTDKLYRATSMVVGSQESWKKWRELRANQSEADAAKALIDQGADVIMQHTDSPAPLQVAEKRGVYAVGQASDMRNFGKKAHLTAIVNNWAPYYVARTKAVMDGNWQQQDTWHGFKEGMVKMAPYNSAIPAGVVKLAEDTRKGIIAGTIHPFEGEIRDQAGKVRIPAGKRADDGLMAGMNFYVQGIDGTIPK